MDLPVPPPDLRHVQRDRRRLALAKISDVGLAGRVIEAGSAQEGAMGRFKARNGALSGRFDAIWGNPEHGSCAYQLCSQWRLS